MGRHIPRTAADELRTAQDALAEAKRALHDLQSHLDRIAANPGDAPGIVRSASRNAGIVRSGLDQAESSVRTARATVALDQLSSVS